jgi:hypothetical protein
MKRIYALIALGFASAAIATPAAAKSPPEAYAACLAETRPDQVRQLLSAQTAEAANLPYHKLVDDDRCLSKVFGDKQFSPDEAIASMDVLRGRLAEDELRSEEAKVAVLTPLPLQQKRYIRPWFAATGRHPAVDEMGACMADTDPAGIVALIQTTPGSDDESAAIGALSPALTKCLSAGTRLDASRQALRAALADALYQRLNNPALSQADFPKERGR